MRPTNFYELIDLIDRCDMEIVAEIMPDPILKGGCDCCSDEDNYDQAWEVCDSHFYAVEEELIGYDPAADINGGLWKPTPEQMREVAKQLDTNEWTKEDIGYAFSEAFTEIVGCFTEECWVYIAPKGTRHDLDLDCYLPANTFDEIMAALTPGIRSLKLDELGI